MYNPDTYKSKDIIEAYNLMDNFPFSTLITVVDQNPFISHIPLTPKYENNKIVLIGHLASANSHWKYLESYPTTAIFNGPHTYISPLWYKQNDVPTWNYSIVHAKGSIEIINTHNGLLNCLMDLSAHLEKHWPSGWDFYVPDDLKNHLEKSIVGFKINVNEINFKKKMSQNRSDEDRIGIFKGLNSRSDCQSKDVLIEMKKIFDQDGKILDLKTPKE